MSKRDQTPEEQGAAGPPSTVEISADEVELIGDSAPIPQGAEPNPNVTAEQSNDEVLIDPATPPPSSTPSLERDPWIGESRIETAPEPFNAFDPVPKAAGIPAPRLRIALALFVLTFLSATAVHLMLMLQPGSLRELIDLVRSDPTMLRPALIFSLALMGMLLIHDLGHSLTSLTMKVQQSYPYFIPFPMVLGTLGSVVFLRSPPPHRSALLRMGVMGPIAGLLVAIPIAAYGLSQSLPLDVGEIPPGATWLGNSLLFTWLAETFSPNGVEVQLHPLAFAGWVAMLLTSINLIPAAQLDGGHISHAVLGRAAIVVSMLSVVAVLGYGLYLTLNSSYGAYAGVPWLIWGTLVSVGGFGHPQVRDSRRRLRPLDWLGAGLALAILVLTFVPVPVQVVPANPSQAGFLERERQEEGERDWSVEDPDVPPESFEL